MCRTLPQTLWQHVLMRLYVDYNFTDFTILKMAEGGEITVHISSLEEQLSKFSVELLDSPCADVHLVKLSESIAEWRDLSPYLHLSQAEERGILTAFPPATPARQRIDMLRTWKEKLGTNATYR